MQISISNAIGRAISLGSYASKLIKAFKARVLSYPTSIFEAEACLDATLTELNAIGLLKEASLVITPNAYKESVLYSVVPNTTLGDMDVVRATTATRVNSAGLIESVGVNIPRIDYTNGSCPSILVEPQRTNLVTYSNDFLHSSWLKSAVTITPNYSISPDGNFNASFIEDTTSFNRLEKTVFVLNDTRYAFSIYVKNPSSGFISLRCASGTNDVRKIIELNTNTVTDGGGNNVGFIFANSKLISNGWYRVTIVVRSGGTSFTSSFYPDKISSTIQNNCEIWGAQLESGSDSFSYIPTVATSVTRNADVISKTGISSLIGQTEGTIFFDGKINALPVDGSLFGIQKNASNFVIRFGSQGTNIYAQSYNGSANLFFEATPYTLGSRVKAAFAYKAGSYAFYINGVQIATGSNTTAIPACDATMFNSLWGNFTGALSFYSASGLWKTRLTNAELAELTTI